MEAAATPPEHAGTPPPESEHRIAVRVLVVAASVLAFLSIFTTWIDRQALDTDEWVDTSGRLLEDEEISDAVANYAVDQLFASVDVSKLLRERLPDDIKPLSGPAAGGLREFAVRAAERGLQTPRLQTTWRDANRTAHQQLVAILEDRSAAVSTAEGVVILDLKPIVEQLATQIGLGQEIAQRLPPDVAQLEIARSDQLDTARTVTKLVKGLGILFSLGALALFGAAAYLARGRRWMVVLGYGVGLVVAGVAALALREVMGQLVVDELVKSEAVRPAAQDAYAISTELLTGVATTVIAYGVLFVLASFLASPADGAVAVRRALAPSFLYRPGIVWGAFAGGVLLFLILSPPQSNRELLTTLALLVMAAAGMEALSRKIRREFPGAKPGDLRERWRERIGELGAEGTRRMRSAIDELTDGDGRPSDPEDVRLERLAKLGELRDQDILTEEEFEAEKRRVLQGQGQGTDPEG